MRGWSCSKQHYGPSCVRFWVWIRKTMKPMRLKSYWRDHTSTMPGTNWMTLSQNPKCSCWITRNGPVITKSWVNAAKCLSTTSPKSSFVQSLSFRTSGLKKSSSTWSSGTKAPRCPKPSLCRIVTPKFIQSSVVAFFGDIQARNSVP